MKDVLKFWVDKGVSGFRVDAMARLFESPINGLWQNEPRSDDPNCPDPNDHCYLEHVFTQDQDETFNMMYQWRKFLDDYKLENEGESVILMVESYSDIEVNMKYYGNRAQAGAVRVFLFLL